MSDRRMNDTRRAVLDALGAGPVSGPTLAERLGISRTGVWKHIDTLRSAGFSITSTDDGYEVTGVPEYGALAVGYELDAPYDVVFAETVESTNDWARELASDGCSAVIVLADEQVGGRGRLGREWASPSGGIWMSILFRPDLPPARVPVLTLGAGVAVAEALASVGIDAGIKWPNDVIVPHEDGYGKIAGLLTEMEGESNRVSWVIIGMGVNANIPASSLPTGATSVQELVGMVDRRDLVQRIVEAFDSLRVGPDTVVLDQWRDWAVTLGEAVRVETASDVIVGTAVDVSDVGALRVETEEGLVTVHAGDCTHLRHRPGT